MAPPAVLDGGWGWAVVLGGAINNFLSMGFYRSGGIIYISCTNTFGTSRAVASWIPMVTLMVVYLLAPVGTLLCKRFSYPRVTLIGGLLASFGMFICYLATSIEYMFVGWGIIFGFGSSLAFFPTIAIVGQYFKVKRPLANGLVLTGGALGAFCLPPLLQHLVQTYGLNGTTLITSAVTLHYCITSGLLLMAESRTRHNRDQTKKRFVKSTASEKTVQCHSNEVSLEDEVSEKEKRDVNVDNIDNNGHEELSVNGKATETASTDKPTNTPICSTASNLHSNSDVNLTSSCSTTPRPKDTTQLTENAGNGAIPASNEASQKKEQSAVSQSLNGDTIDVSLDLCTNFHPDLKTGPTNDDKEDTQTLRGHMKIVSTFKNIVESLELREICNSTFLINCGSNAIQNSLFMGLVTILPDYGEDELGIPRMQAAYFVSASAIADLLTRFLSGWILSNFAFDKSLLCFFVLLINGGVFVILALIHNYIIIMICSILAGICFAFGMVLYFEILASCQSVDKYPLAFGLSEMMKSPLLLLTAASVGGLKDATGSYSVTLFIFCSFDLLATSLWLLRRLFCKKT